MTHTHMLHSLLKFKTGRNLLAVHNLDGLVDEIGVDVLPNGFDIFGTRDGAFGEVVVDVLCGYGLEGGELGEAP